MDVLHAGHLGVGRAALCSLFVPRREGAAACFVRAVARGAPSGPGAASGSREAVKMAAKASATNHLPDPSGRATTRRRRFPEAVGEVASAREAS